MTEQTNTPELRFPEFKNEWKNNILKNMATTFSGGTPSSTNKSLYVGEIPFIRSGEINSLTTEMKISQKALEKSSAKMVNEGDILYALYGATSGEVAISKIEGAINQAVLCIRTKQITSFLYQYLKLKKSNILNKYLQGGQGNLSAKIIKNIALSIPDIKEQRKIGDFFSKLDRQIELEEEKLELLEQQKRGYMQKLFSQELRFKDENGNEYPNWQTVKIGSILKERKERSGDGEMLSVTINHGIVKFDDIDRKDNSSKDKSNYKKVYKNDIAYNSMRMWQGASGKAEFDGIVSPAYTVVTPIENINSSFIAYYFKTHNIIHKFRINSQGLTSDTWNLKYKQLKDIKINICSKEEQDKIADLLTILDTRIKKQNHKLEILNINKKGLLQKMFV